MLLFADGFETFNYADIWRKWGGFRRYANIPVIVHGADTTYSPAKQYATRADGRAIQGGGYSLGTPIKPSRTVFVGFACRATGSPSYYNITVFFGKNCVYDKSINGIVNNDYKFDTATLVATCDLRIYPSYIDVTWTFVGTNPLTKTGRINSSAVLTSGDFRYLQVGLTLTGNVVAQPQAWAEVRLGSRGGANNLLHSSIMTGPESGGSASFLINSVVIRTEQLKSTGLDDFYICNDEGDYNNNFLGNVKVRRVSVSGDGSENNSVPFGETYRYRTVDEDFIDTVNSLPVPLPDPETTPLFIPWETFAGNYLTIEEYGDRQLLRYNSLNLTGTYSKIHGAILHALVQPLHLDTPATLTAVRKFGIESPIESKPMDAPLIKRTQFEARQFVWENEETIEPGQQYDKWTATAVDASEWGFQLEPVTIDPITYDPAVVRVNIIFNEPLNETIDLADFTHRYFEEIVAESIHAADAPGYEWTWLFTETFGFTEVSEMSRAGNRFLNETIEFSEYLPYTIMFVGEFIGFSDDLFVQYIDLIDETIDAADWADGFWEELFTDTFKATDHSEIAFILTLEEMFGLEEPYLWDNHELIEEEFTIDADEPWDNHELVEEYLYPDDFTQSGVGLIAEDEIGMTEDHHDGWWAGLFTDYTLLADSVLTQHWRYDIVFGMVLDSWQVDPNEQYGNDGNHTGDNPWGA